MLVHYLPAGYIAGMLGWLLLAGLAFCTLLKCRQRHRADARRRRWIHAGLSLWLLLAAMTGGELYFALFVDESDALNLTNVSKRWFDRHIEAQRNAAGLRDRAEFNPSPPQGLARICFIGDSFTIGHGLPRCEDRFTDLVGDRLERSRPGQYQVANLADPGLEVSQIEARVHGLLRAGYEMDQVAYVVCLNDIEGYDPRTADAIAQIQAAQPRCFLWTDTYFLNWLYFRYVQLTCPGTRDYFPHLANSYDGEPWDGFSEKLGEMNDRCREHEVELRVVVFPFLTELGGGYPFLNAHRRIVEWCHAAGVRVLDLEPIFREHAGEGLTVNRFDSHPNEKAHRIAADAMCDRLFSDLLDEQPAR